MDLDSQPKRSHTPKELSRKTSNRIEIPLLSEYKPGSGPPLQPVTIVPEHDSTAYICDSTLLPANSLAEDGKPRPKILNYLVRWHDLPLAAMLVPAKQILDYVSPLALEEWEHNRELKLDEARQKLEAGKKKGESQQPLAAPSRRRGAPPNYSQIESAVITESEDELANKTTFSGGPMGLSMPQNSRLMDFDEGSSEDEYEESSATSKQLVSDVAGGSMMDLDGIGPNLRLEENKRDEHNGERVTPVQNSLERSGLGRLLEPEAPATISVQSTGQSTGQHASSSKSPLALQQTPVPMPSYAILSQKKLSSPTRTLGSKISEGKVRPEAHQDTEWELDRVEDVKLFNIEGRGLVRHFRVRWAGDWPADQNPTWEPEENLSPKIVRNFLKTPKGRRYRDDTSESVETPRTNTLNKEENENKRRRLELKWLTPHPQKKSLKQSTLSWKSSSSSVNGAKGRGGTNSTGDRPANVETPPVDAGDRDEKFPSLEDDKDEGFHTHGFNQSSDDELLIVNDGRPSAINGVLGTQFSLRPTFS